jgi:rRNA biogenesis protein Nop56/Nop58
MSEENGSDRSWIAQAHDHSIDAEATAIQEGSAANPRDWPRDAVVSGHMDSEAEYYARLQEAALHAAQSAVTAASTANDNQLIHAIRMYDDLERTANELAERVTEWRLAVEPFSDTDARDIEALASSTPESPAETRLIAVAKQVIKLREERNKESSFIETHASAVCPNLAEMAGPLLAARLLSHAGGLEPLAKTTAGTVQVLGAEDALFAHLNGQASSPKHGIIYIHPAIQQAVESERGSAARALAGKLVIAARVDHYSGEFTPSIHSDLETRMKTIHSREATEE